ncbi:hypothetical protein [Pseudarthrobacter sp. SSS035]|uniref:hypothetical protein n=1 Tax=Pseudarthrobacter sp. SSS035 TaxID=2931399 RepID=UPI00200E9549|nr:hypothetical protein [Pseudarthrobacter sp. SSS035]
MQHRIKAPTTVAELGDLAEWLGMDIVEVWDLLDDALGEKWWKHGLGEVTFTFSSAVAAPPQAPTPPSGYVRSKKGSERWIGDDIVKGPWIVTPVWNAATNTHTIELWMANHKRPRYAQLSPADAYDLAADLIAAAKTAQTAGGTN